MPNRLFQPPYTGIAVVQYFAYRMGPGGAVPATDEDVRFILDQSLNMYRASHSPHTSVMRVEPIFQNVMDRGGDSNQVLRIIRDTPRRIP